MNVIFLRHAETLYTHADSVQGHTDTDLASRGEEQAAELGDAVRDKFDIDVIYTSDLSRAKDTAKHMEIDAPMGTDPRLREQDFGDVTSHVLDEFIENNPEYAASNPDAAWTRFPNGECLGDVYQRVGEFLDDLVAARDGDETILIVGHHTSISTAHAYITGGDADDAFEVDVPLCEGFRATADGTSEWEFEEWLSFGIAE